MLRTPDWRQDFRDARVLVTGHTGFKGAWLCEWLMQAGAQVSGLALPPDHPHSLCSQLGLETRLVNHMICDVREPEAVAAAVRRSDPEIIFHLAAQALVRRSYRQPLYTWHTNVNGTLHVLEGARGLDHPVTAVVVTTDKVYRNREWEFSYREDDELGGHDPYSASKAACELAVASWRASFGNQEKVTVVTARAGNVIGGGDFSEDRIVPDCYRAWALGEYVELRNARSTRPWQHVLEPVAGYLMLARYARAGAPEIHACNFGPGIGGDQSVETLVTRLAAMTPGRNWRTTTAPQPHEARTLALCIDRAQRVLGWSPRLNFHEAVDWTDRAYSAGPGRLADVVRTQIEEFAERQKLPNTLA